MARRRAGTGSTSGKIQIQSITNKASSIDLKRYVSTLEKMGFPEMYAVAALRQTDNDINASMDVIQEHPGENHVHNH